MRAIHTVVRSAVALVVLAVAAVAVEAPAPAVKMAESPASVTATAAEAPAQGTQAAPSALSTETQSVHVQVGRSIILNTQARLRRIVVSSPDVLDTATISPTQLVITAKAPGSSSLVLWDEANNARIVDVYADVDVAGLRESIRSAHPDEPVDVAAEEGRIVLTGKVSTKAAADDVVRLASLYAKGVVDSMVVAKPPRAKQVLLKVQFVEVDRTKLTQFGINILSTGAAGNFGQTSTQQFGAPINSVNLSTSIGASLAGSSFSGTVNNLLNIFIFRPDLNLGATIQALQTKNIAQILAEPNLLARSGEPAKFLAGGEFPVPVVQGGSGSTGNAITIVFKPFGVKLEFTGTIEGDVIRLKIAPEVSTLDFSNATILNGFTIPAVSTRRAETEIELKNNQSFAMAGLLDRRTQKQLSKIPGIGDIPVLGNLFRSRSYNRTDTELLVMVTPQIVDPVSEQVAAPTGPSMPIPDLNKGKFDESVKQPVKSGNIN